MGGVSESKARVVNLSLVNSTPAYAVGDQLDGLQTITNAFDDSSGTATIVSVTVIDAESTSTAMDVLFFNDQPTVSSTDNVSLNISDSEMASKFLGSVRISTTDYISLAGNSVGTTKNQQLVVNSVKSQNNLSGTSLWAIVRCAGTPTFSGTTALNIRVGIKQD